MEYFNEARNYLLSFNEVTEEVLQVHLSDWKNKKPKTISCLFEKILVHAQNRQGMPNSIGNIDNLKGVLFNFSPKEVAENYCSWEELFEAVEKNRPKPPGRLDKSNAKSYWVIYCKSILSAANFLKSYPCIEDFDKFVSGFLTNEYSRLALPLLLKEEIFGFGFALACDFLKENGYPEFLKPDTHVNDIARNIGISQASNDFGIFKDVEAYSKKIGKLPYEVDKIFWLIGSGKFYLLGLEIRSSKWDFIKRVKELEEQIAEKSKIQQFHK